MACAAATVVYQNDSTTSLLTSLVERPYNDRNKVEKIEIIKNGRPMITIDLVAPQGSTVKLVRIRRQTIMKNKSPFFNQHKWLTGCERSNKLHCWPCLLFAPDSCRKNEWVEGINYFDARSFVFGVTIHSETEDHKANTKSLVYYEEKTVDELTQVFEKGINLSQKIAHNTKVSMNRAVIQGLIDVAVWLYQQDVYVDPDWFTPEKFQNLFNLIISQDQDLKNHCQELGDTLTTIIRPFFFKFLDDLETSLMCTTVCETLKSESQHLCSIQVDSVADVTGKKNKLLFATLRYVDDWGGLCERFLGIRENSSGDVAKVSKCLWKILERLKDNVISQSYDGACTPAEYINILTDEIQSMAPCAVLFPSIDHPLSKVILQSSNWVEGVQIFVATIEDLVENPTVLTTLTQLTRTETESGTMHRHWKVGSELLQFLLAERESFISEFCHVPEDTCLSSKTHLKVARFLDNLQDFHFVFLLILYNAIFEITEQVSEVIENKLSDGDLCATTVKRAVMQLLALRNRERAIDFIEIAKLCTDMPVIEAKYLVLSLNIVENVIDNLNARFGNIQEFEFLNLVDSNKFQSHIKIFPEKALTSFKKVYGKRINTNRLRKQLAKSIYPNELFYSLPVTDIVKLMHELKLTDKIPEAYDLFCLAAVLPNSHAGKDSSYKRLHAYIKECEKHSTEVYKKNEPPRHTGIPFLQTHRTLVFVEKPLANYLITGDDFFDGCLSNVRESLKSLDFDVQAMS